MLAGLAPSTHSKTLGHYLNALAHIMPYTIPVSEQRLMI